MRIATWIGCLLALGMAPGCDDGPADPVADSGVEDAATLPGDGGADAGDVGAEDAAPPTDATVDAEAADLAVDAEVPDQMVEPACGDGHVDLGEECDDGNTVAGDGCDAACAWEVGRVVEPDRRGAPLALHFGADGLAEARFDLERDDDEDWFRFEIEEAVDVAVAVQAADPEAECESDPELAIFLGDSPAFVVVDDTDGSVCPRVGPINEPSLVNLAAGEYLIRARSAIGTSSGGYALRVWQRARIPVEAPCDATGLLGRCADGARCGRVDYESGAGVCLPPGCGDWRPDPGEACDGDDGHCGADCRLLAEMEVEPNDTPETATPMGPGVEGFGEVARAIVLGALDDVDSLRISVPAGPAADLRVGIYDGFFECPGALRVTLLAADGAVVGRLDDACGINDFRGIPTGADYVLQISADAAAATQVPLFVFAQVRPQPIVGEACSPARDCVEGAWCVAEVCVADVCGDARQGPNEACDDGNLEAGDGCDPMCGLEEARVDPPGGVLRFNLVPGGRRRYLFDLAEPASVHAATGGEQVCPGDTRLRLLDAEGVLIAENNDADEGTICSALVASLPAGQGYTLWLDSPVAAPIFEGELTVRFEAVLAAGSPCGPPDPALCVAGTWCNTDHQCAPTICGNFEVDPTEDCDDGNLDSGDGCDSACRFEAADVSGGADLERFGFDDDLGDFYSFEIATAMRLRAWTDNNRGRCSADTIMTLDRIEGGDWIPIAEDDDGGLTVCSRIDRPIPPGRYELAVFGTEGYLDPYWMHVRLQPQLADGEPCTRSGEVDACLQDRICRPGPQEGVGECGLLAPFIDEIEPDHQRATAQRIRPDVAVRAHLDLEFLTDDFVDLFVVTLDAPARLRVQTGDGELGCPGDTVLYKIEPDDLALGLDAALENAPLAADDMDNLRCSEIERDLEAGEHWFAVEVFNREAPLDYVFRARTLEVGGPDARCDAHGVFDRCADGLTCLDPDGDGDGRCGVAD